MRPVALGSALRWLTGMAALIALLTIARAAPEAPLPLFNAEYSLKRNGIALGVSTRTLSANRDGSFLYASTTQATGFIAWFVKDRIDEHSNWTYNGKRLRPLEYVYNRYGGSKTRKVKLSFDWQHNTVTNSIDGDPWRMDVPPDAQDKLVYQLSIMHDLMNGKKDLAYKIADGGKMKDYVFAIEGEEILNTDIGRIKTVRIQRSGDKRDTTVWCAPQLSYLPVRLAQQDTDGSELTMQITAVRGIARR